MIIEHCAVLGAAGLTVMLPSSGKQYLGRFMLRVDLSCGRCLLPAVPHEDMHVACTAAAFLLSLWCLLIMRQVSQVIPGLRSTLQQVILRRAGDRP